MAEAEESLAHTAASSESGEGTPEGSEMSEGESGAPGGSPPEAPGTGARRQSKRTVDHLVDPAAEAKALDDLIWRVYDEATNDPVRVAVDVALEELLEKGAALKEARDWKPDAEAGREKTAAAAPPPPPLNSR